MNFPTFIATVSVRTCSFVGGCIINMYIYFNINIYVYFYCKYRDKIKCWPYSQTKKITG